VTKPVVARDLTVLVFGADDALKRFYVALDNKICLRPG